MLRCSLGRVQSYTPSLCVLQNSTFPRNITCFGFVILRIMASLTASRPSVEYSRTLPRCASCKTRHFHAISLAFVVLSCGLWRAFLRRAPRSSTVVHSLGDAPCKTRQMLAISLAFVVLSCGKSRALLRCSLGLSAAYARLRYTTPWQAGDSSCGGCRTGRTSRTGRTGIAANCCDSLRGG